MFDPATQHCSHGCVEQAVAEKADPLRTMVAELPESQARFRMHEPDANEIDSFMPAQHCGDNQLPWQWTDNPAGEPDATFSKASAGQCLHAHVPQLASHEMVAGQLSSTSYEQHSLVQPEAGPSSHYYSLSPYSRDPRNFIIDSVHPITPHIVVTRPEPVWDEYYLNAQNRVEYQWPTHLSVPPPERGYGSPAIFPTASPEAYIPVVHAVTSSCEPTTPRRRRRSPPAFSKAHFNEVIDYAVWDRESYPNVVTSLLRRIYLLSAIAAASEAHSWRPMYDDPSWSCAVEQPFSWTDPADAILPAYRSFRGTTILDSIIPLRAPHIVINEPPPQNPWVGYFNIPNDPQDAGFGSRLTVPWARVVNEPHVPTSPIVETHELDPGHLEAYEPSAEDQMSDNGTTVHVFTLDMDVPVEEDLFGDEPSEETEVSPFEMDEGSASDEGSDDSRPETPAPETPMDSPVLQRLTTASNKVNLADHWPSVPTFNLQARTRPRQRSL